MSTDANLHKFAFGFIDQLYDAYQNENKAQLYEKRIQFYINSINETEEWKEAVRIKAIQRNISLEKAILADAKYMAEQDAQIEK